MDEQVKQYQDPSISPAFFDAAAKALGDEVVADEQVSEDAPVSTEEEGEELESQEAPDEDKAEQDGDEADDSEEPVFPVTLDGQEQKVKLSELLAGYQRHSDYTKKAMAVSEERKQVEALKSEVAQLRDAEAQKLEMLEAALRPNLPTQQDLQAALQASMQDPAQTPRYLAMQAQVQQYQTLMAHREMLAKEQAARTSAETQQRMKEQAEKLYTVMPELKKDEAKTALVNYLVNAGYSEQEISGVSDARDMIMAEKARRYDELMAKKPTAMNKVSGAPKVVKQGARVDSNSLRVQGVKEAKAKFYQNPNDDNAAIEFFKAFV